jgi:hypothetical protein
MIRGLELLQLNTGNRDITSTPDATPDADLSMRGVHTTL